MLNVRFRFWFHGQSAVKLLTKEAQRIAANFAKLPELLRKAFDVLAPCAARGGTFC